MIDQDAETEAAAEWVPVEDLKPWVDNPRVNDKAVAQVAKSIKRFGFGAPVLARRANGELIAGHTRLKAAIRLGLKRVPVRYLDLDPADAHLLALADNKVGELADWDDDKLAAILHQLKADDQDLIEGTGFTDKEIDKLLSDEDAGAAADESDLVLPKFEVLVECDDEEHQRDVISKLTELGLECRALLS
jgi:ParB-like chromosome segregation protein Spo0J